MQTCDHHISELKQSPMLPQAIAELNAFWKKEQELRTRFLAELDDSTKAEFIEGKIVLHSPAKEQQHNAVVAALSQLIGFYIGANKLGIVRLEKAMLHLSRNNFVPDLAFWATEKVAAITPDTMLYPAPDLVCEVLSTSTTKADRGIKFLDYALNGIEEYWIVDPEKKQLEQYFLKGKNYELAVKSDSGHVESRAIPGLIFQVSAIFDEQLLLAEVAKFLNKQA